MFITAPCCPRVTVRAAKAVVSYRVIVLSVLGRSAGVSVASGVTVRKSYVPLPPRTQPVVTTVCRVTAALRSRTNSARAPATRRMEVTSAASVR